MPGGTVRPGTSVRQRSSGTIEANSQRGLNEQPLGRWVRLGGAPLMGRSSSPTVSLMLGTEPSRPRV